MHRRLTSGFLLESMETIEHEHQYLSPRLTSGFLLESMETKSSAAIASKTFAAHQRLFAGINGNPLFYPRRCI
jgi:hypothetical protein